MFACSQYIEREKASISTSTHILLLHRSQWLVFKTAFVDREREREGAKATRWHTWCLALGQLAAVVVVIIIIIMLSSTATTNK